MSSKQVCFFVHECNLESGHTRAMIEAIRALPEDYLKEIHLVYFEGQSSQKLLPNFKGRVIHHKVPGKFLFPFLLKYIFFQLWCFFLIRFKLNKDIVKIGIGTACLGVDISNIQFIQSQWESHYFKNKSIFSIRYLYKKILFSYFRFCENLLFRNDSTKFLSLSHFVSSFLVESFQVDPKKIKTEYSSVNLEHFPFPTLKRNELFERLKKDYKGLEQLNIEKPIFLFVGAFERKGLPKALDLLSQSKDGQIIVVGKGEHSQDKPKAEGLNIIHISFSKEIALFYQLSDYFIFPTIYEPFGLVIAEAASMGCRVLTFKENVGASEILNDLESVFFLDKSHFDFQEIEILSFEQRSINANQVRERLKQYNWSKPAKALEELLNSF